MDDERRPPLIPYPSGKQQYLTGYNALCLVLWSTILGRTVLLVPSLYAHDKLHGLLEAVFPLLKITQTLALMEVVHAATGLVRASPVTTSMQVASRLLIVWGVLNIYPETIVYHNRFGRNEEGPYYAAYALAGLLFAWSITECIRYGFFVWKEGITERVPAWLSWLRYNTFFVLYPLGISCECFLIWCATIPASKSGTGYEWFLRIVLGIYVPGSYILYTHMMAQRRKVIKGKGRIA